MASSKWLRLTLPLLLFVIPGLRVTAQDPDTAVDFWISDSLMKRLADENTILFSIRSKILARNASPHGLADDCEMHLAGKPLDASDKASPAATVFEPPNLCKQAPSDLPGGDGGFGSWSDLFENVAVGHDCTALGFPRLYDEHLESSSGPSSPGHFLEIHPALQLTCGQNAYDFRSFLKYHPGMKRSKDSTIAGCLEKKQLFVRRTTKNNVARWEFFVKGGGNCGNFALLTDARINGEWVRKINGGHSALARVRVNDKGPFTLKIYTYDGTADDQFLASIASDAAEQVSLHGMLTYDYFSILKTIRNQSKQWKSVPNWTEVRFPLALVVFGRSDEPIPPDE